MDFSKILGVIKLVKELVPLVKDLVHYMNEIIPEAKQGKEKLEILMGILKGALDSVGGFADDVKEAALDIIDKFVDVYIKIRKKIEGTF